MAGPNWHATVDIAALRHFRSGIAIFNLHRLCSYSSGPVAYQEGSFSCTEHNFQAHLFWQFDPYMAWNRLRYQIFSTS